MFTIRIQVPFTGWEEYTCARIDRSKVSAWFRNLVDHVPIFNKIQVYDGKCLVCECLHRKEWFNYSINNTYITRE